MRDTVIRVHCLPSTSEIRRAVDGRAAVLWGVMVVTACSALGCGQYYAFSFPRGGVTIEDKGGHNSVQGGGALLSGETGDISYAGRGFSAEGRLFDFLMLPPSPDTRFMLDFATFGVRYTALSLYTSGARSTGVSGGGGVSRAYYTRGPDITVDYQVLGVGAFLRGSPANWTIHLGADPEGVYDPYLAAGLWARASLPTMLGPGIEFSVGGMGSREVGALLFGTIDVLLGQAVK